MRNHRLLALAVSLSAAMPVIASAQLGTEPARVEAAVTPEPGATVGPQATGSTVNTHFVHDTQVLVPKSSIARLAPAPDEGGSHTVVISTLALVLGIILIVVLVAR